MPDPPASKGEDPGVKDWERGGESRQLRETLEKAGRAPGSGIPGWDVLNPRALLRMQSSEGA